MDKLLQGTLIAVIILGSGYLVYSFIIPASDTPEAVEESTKPTNNCEEKPEFSEFLGIDPEEMQFYDPSQQELDAFNALLEEWNNCVETLDWQTYRNEEDTVITDNGSTKTFISKFGINVTFPNSWGIMSDTLERYGTLEEAEAVGGNHFALFFDDPETSGPGQTVGGNDIKIEFWPSTSSGKTSSQLSEEAKQEALSFALEFEGTQNNLELSDTELIFNNVDAASYSRNTAFGSRSHIVYIAGEKYDISIVIFGSTDSPHFSEVAGIIDSLAID